MSTEREKLDSQNAEQSKAEVLQFIKRLESQLAESKQREATLTQERDAARNALHKYGQHLPPCLWATRVEGSDCVCGFQSALTDTLT